MSDKEPRRRKKRKDIQTQRKEDISTDDQFFPSSKSDVKDSDQEAEEEIAVPSYQPSAFAKFVFIILFSCLVISMSFIFISLRGADRGSIGIFDDHQDEHEVAHDDSHDEAEGFSSESFQESFSDILPGIGSLLSYNDEHLEEPDSGNLEETDETVQESPIYQSSENTEATSDLEFDSSTTQNSAKDELPDTGQFFEDLITSEMFPESSSESVTVKPKIVSRVEEPEPVTREPEYDDFEPENEPDLGENFEYTSENLMDYSDFTTLSPEPTPNYETEYESMNDIETSSSKSSLSDELHLFVEDEEDDLEEEASPLSKATPNVEEAFSPYEKAEITDEDDYKIRDQLDDLDAVLAKDANGDEDDDDEDDDDYNGEEGDEFDFWQF